jgi:type I restriction enzyme S subunit
MLSQSGISRNKYVKLASLCIRPPQNGIYKKPSEDQFVPPKNAKIAKMKQLFTDNPISQENELDDIFVTDKEMKTFRLTNADLVFGRRSLVEEGAGKCSLVGDIGGNIVFESSLLRITLDLEKVLPIWIYSWFHSDEGKEEVKRIRNVVTIAGIKGSDLKEIYVPAVDMIFQNRFAEFVRQADKSKFAALRLTKTAALLYNSVNGG